jgi:hypothetical protein
VKYSDIFQKFSLIVTPHAFEVRYVPNSNVGLQIIFGNSFRPHLTPSLTGRVYKTGQHTCAVSDIASWTDAMGQCVKIRFPEVSIAVRHSTQSLTGFNLLFTLHRSAHTYAGSVVLFIIIFSTMGFMWYTSYNYLMIHGHVPTQ